MDPEATTGLTLESKVCTKCGAKWLNGQHYWSTGIIGDDQTLSNLVCSLVESPDCVNPVILVPSKNGNTFVLGLIP